MKILIFSDTHLTTKFKQKKFNFLKRIIQDSDKVIIAGDFWEGKLITFDEFVNSEWNQLFPILKDKQAVYVFGNHDKKSFSDSRTSDFSDKQTQEYIFKEGKNTYIVRHGDTQKIKYSLIKNVMSITNMSEKFFMKHLHEDLEHIFVKLFGRNMLQLLFKKYNTVIKNSERKNLKENTFFICGHTHAAEIDLHNNFINTGIIRHGLGQYVTVEENKINLHEEKY